VKSPKKQRGGIGQYVLGKTIGEGTFGKVKLGVHVLSGETVAVKILERQRIKEIADVERVAREIHILKRVQHPHIIQLYEIIETPDQLYLIMEYCSGGELFDHIVESGRVTEPEACRFFQQILSGVEQVHRINVVHRDLKPENLLLDEHKNIKIVDFGLSNIFKDDQLLKTACGSPCYASPEMIAGHWYVPARCDVWSCGVILFALVCGYLPFEDGNTAALYRKILAADYATPKFISQSVRSLIARMLTTDPEKRITVAEIRQHEWYQAFGPEASLNWDAMPEEEDLDEELLQALDGFGFARDFAVQSLKAKKHNSASTTYSLLQDRKRRGESVEPAELNCLQLQAGSDAQAADSSSTEESGEGEKKQAEPDSQMKHSRKHNNGGSLSGGTHGQTQESEADKEGAADVTQAAVHNGRKGRGKRGKNNGGEGKPASGYPAGGSVPLAA